MDTQRLWALNDLGAIQWIILHQEVAQLKQTVQQLYTLASVQAEEIKALKAPQALPARNPFSPQLKQPNLVK